MRSSLTGLLLLPESVPFLLEETGCGLGQVAHT